MTTWIEIREKLPPPRMQVLFYVIDEIDGYTEDYVKQGFIINIENEGTYDKKVEYSFSLEPHERVGYWTLLPNPPVTWK